LVADELIKALSEETIKPNTFSSFHGQPATAPAEVSFGPDTLFGSFSLEVKDELSKIAQESAKTMEKRNIPIPRLS
jgi:hypothetical protein